MSLTGKIEDDNIPLADDDPQGNITNVERSIKRSIEFNHFNNVVFNYL